MQVARLQHPRSRTIAAKVHEAAEGLLLINRRGHDAVLRQYLTIAPYGNRTHGIVRAANLYFDKPIEDLSWLQAAYLAALPQQPSRMSPWTKDGHKQRDGESAANSQPTARARRHRRRRPARGADVQSRAPHVTPCGRSSRCRGARVEPSSSERWFGRSPHHHRSRSAARDVPGTRKNLDSLRTSGAGNTAGVVVELPVESARVRGRARTTSTT